MPTPSPVPAARADHRLAVVAFALGLIGCGSAVPQPPGSTPEKKGELAAKVYRSAEELLADLPKDKYPFGGAPERAACTEWLKANVVGRTVEWKATVSHVSDHDNGPYVVKLQFAGPRQRIYTFYHTQLGNGGTPSPAARFGPAFKLDGKHCVGLIPAARPYPEDGVYPDGFGGYLLGEWREVTGLIYTGCTAADVKAFRGLVGEAGKEKTVVFRATIREADVTLKDFPARDDQLPQGAVPPDLDPKIDPHPATGFLFGITAPSADGFIPAACRPKR
jgi:hypothetical protein